MQLSNLDWTIVGGFFLLSLVIGLYFSKRAGKSYDEYFLSGRNMPWWLLGISMVATTFSADTPNLVTDIVRRNGVAGNWVWWAFLLTGMLTVFVYARLWRRSGIATDLEFYELRYSGKAAAFLRGFRAIYLGVFFNIMIMASVSLAAIKIGGILLGLSPEQTLLIASIVTIAYTALGGLTGVIWTDFFQFALAMAGTIWAAVVVVDL
ncbi:MAG: Na+:solute symporter, partial [Saprospiraceae bacterium]|nr:Na+:solute symporter [Saprospiraceae bacterium]